jgi:serine/threonine protein phosphatase PrpC
MKQMQSESQSIETTSSSTEEATTRKLPFSFAYFTLASERHPERNEDTVVVDQKRGLAAVFDGVGGSAAGEVASQLAATVVKEGWKRHQKTQTYEVRTNFGPYVNLDVPAILQELIAEAHEQIRSDGAKRRTSSNRSIWSDDQATTVALAVITQQEDDKGHMLVYAHVGDSRIYLLRGDEGLKRLTEDDSILTELVKNHELGETQALRIDQAIQEDDLSDIELACFQQRNGITQALGDSQSLQVHIAETPLLPGDRILLCTDGIHDNLTDAEIEDILRKGKRPTAARRLVEQALQRSQEDRTSLRAKADDMSAIVITYSF